MIPPSSRSLSPPPSLPSAVRPVVAAARRMPRRHVLMLALALEILVLGFRNADRYRPPGITVDTTVTAGHIIT